MRLLGIDFGFARIGLAVTDDAVGLPTALPALNASGKLKTDAAALVIVARRQEAEKAILGLPLENGEEGKMARVMRGLGGHLADAGLVVDYVDETLTSVEAETALRTTDLKASQRRKARDGEAACRILERYLGEVKRWIFSILGLLLAGALVAAFLFYRALGPVGGTAKGYLRVDAPTPRLVVLEDAEAKGYVRSAKALDFFATLTGKPATIGIGTYRQSAALGGRSDLFSLYRPVVQMLRLPSTNWSKRDARLLQKYEVCDADAYLAEVNHPGGRTTAFPLPDDTLEGYLYPDTYDLPPLLGAKAVVGRQLRAFEEKVWEPLGHPKGLRHLLTVASLVELEAGRDDERPIIAGVIENRLARHMRLQIDASLLYGMGKWRRLTFRDYREFDSPYNLYRVDGLPPTPICSPSIASIRAAMNPARHNYLYYVALPDGHSLFAATYEEHKKNIEKRKEALKALGKA